MEVIYVLIMLITILLGLVDFIILREELKSKKRLYFIIGVQFAAVTILAIMTYRVAVSDARDTQTIIDTGNYNKHLAEQTQLITKQIDSLQNLDDSIMRHSDSLGNKIDSITDISKVLTNNINQLVKEQSEENALTGKFDFDTGRPLNGTDEITVHYGSMTATNRILDDPKVWWAGMHLIKFSDGFEPIVFGLDNHKLLISVDVYDLNGNLIVKIDKNYWHRFTNNTGIFNYDKNGFEVFDNRGNIALSMDFKSQKIDIQGYLIERSRGFIMIAGKELIAPYAWGSRLNEEYLMNLVSQIKFRQLFKYTGSNWLHQRM